MLSADSLTSLLNDCKNMVSKLETTIAEINKYLMPTETHNISDWPKGDDIETITFKSKLKLTPEKNTIYIKFHKQREGGPALRNDNLMLCIQHNGYNVPMYSPYCDGATDYTYLSQMWKLDNNMYAVQLNIKLISTDSTETAPIIKLDKDRYIMYDHLTICLRGDGEDINAATDFVTFSTDVLV